MGAAIRGEAQEKRRPPSKSRSDGKAFAVEPPRQAGAVMDIEIDESSHGKPFTTVCRFRQYRRTRLLISFPHAASTVVEKALEVEE
ncbi:hypothetical protein RGQ15_03215 [Paracoccus sp. MBLB3053]|uniref:Uncharacterized protein n=1 Tax=Paracoccus aurantius TaxID=3073814 RepID=A0ABU2HNH2_9RHOB|nr:hypothetical protein [Paracoccus sp. MBLB3053]MDS9466588.1 hypothetical protein [Paracoccus sp. MBLB3053]